MAATSPVPDSIDPAPRILRLMASAVGARPEYAELVRAWRRTAEILEGAAMTDAEANLAHGRLLAKERRVKKVIREGPNRSRVIAKPGEPPRLSPEDERARQREIENGTYEEDSA